MAAARYGVTTNELTGITASAERDFRRATVEREESTKQLSVKDLRQAADLDPDVASALRQATGAISERDKAAAAWQKSLADASKKWEASLEVLARLHPEPDDT